MVAKETCATKLWAGWLAAVQVNVEFLFAVLVGVRVGCFSSSWKVDNVPGCLLAQQSKFQVKIVLTMLIHSGLAQCRYPVRFFFILETLNIAG